MIPTRSVLRALAVIVPVALLGGGCTTPPPVAPAMPDVPAAFRAGEAGWVRVAPAEAQPRGAWWTIFDDPQLAELIEASSEANTSIQAAAARLAKARSLVGAAEADRKPQVVGAAGYDRQGGPLINKAGASGNLYTVSVGASYEVDLFGRLAGTVDAATLDAEAREALLQSTRLMVHADVAQTYLALRMLDVERAVVRATWHSQQATLRVAERRFALGSVAELDVARLRTDAAAAQAELLVLDRRRSELEHALALLCGRVASTFRLDERDWSVAVPNIPPGIPAAVLARRPDIAAVQHAMRAAQARLGVAQASWLPGVTLTTAQGFASAELRNLLAMSARAYGLGALLALPLFDGGRREAAVQGARADLETEAVAYRERILTALREVEDQLAALRVLAEHELAQEEAVAAASRASTLAKSRHESGLASQLEWLDAQRTELRHRREALQVRALRHQATVGLVRALGGGWDAPQIGGAGPAGPQRQAALP